MSGLVESWAQTVYPTIPESIHPTISPAGDNFDNLQAVARPEGAVGKFRRRHCFAVVLHDDTARQQLLCDQKGLKGARQLSGNGLSVGDNSWVAHNLDFELQISHPALHAVSAASQSFQTGS